MAVGVLWYAQQAQVHIANALSSVGTTSPIYAQLTTATGTASGANMIDWTGRVSDVRISGGSRDLTAVNTMGISQLQFNNRPEIMTAEFTLIYKGDASAAYIAGPASVTFSYTGTLANTGTFSRYIYGEKSTALTDRALLCAVFTLDNGIAGVGSPTGNNTVYVSMNNAVLTNREYSLAADGYLEEKWTIKCLAQNYYEEDNFS